MERGKRPISRAVKRFCVLVLAALALQGVPWLVSRMDGDWSVALYFLHLYGIIPAAAALIPAWAGAGGVHPMAACFPIGGALLILPVYESPGVGLICLLLSLIGATAGREWQKRRQSQAKKGNHHGGKTKKK